MKNEKKKIGILRIFNLLVVIRTVWPQNRWILVDEERKKVKSLWIFLLFKFTHYFTSHKLQNFLVFEITLVISWQWSQWSQNLAPSFHRSIHKRFIFFFLLLPNCPTALGYAIVVTNKLVICISTTTSSYVLCR